MIARADARRSASPMEQTSSFKTSAIPFLRYRSLVCVLSLVFAVALAEIAFWVYDALSQADRDGLAGASYTLTLFTSDGKTNLSAHGGRLKLALAPYVPYRHLPNQSDPWFHINSRGFRGEEVDLSPTVTRIALVGGSAAFGSGAPSDDATFAKALERRFEQVQVVNAAVNGYVSAHELAVLRLELMELKPSLVIALDAFNDYNLGRLVSDGVLANTTYEDIEHRLASLQRIHSNPFYSGVTFLRSLIPHLSARLSRLERLPARIRREISDEVPDDHFEKKLELYTQNVRKMHRTAQEAGIGFLVLVQPQRSNVWRHWKYYSERYNRFVDEAETLFRQYEIDCVNLHASEAIQKNHFLVGDDVHFNPQGAEVIAGVVARHILEGGLLSPIEETRPVPILESSLP